MKRISFLFLLLVSLPSYALISTKYDSSAVLASWFVPKEIKIAQALNIQLLLLEIENAVNEEAQLRSTMRNAAQALVDLGIESAGKSLKELDDTETEFKTRVGSFFEKKREALWEFRLELEFAARHISRYGLDATFLEAEKGFETLGFTGRYSKEEMMAGLKFIEQTQKNPTTR